MQHDLYAPPPARPAPRLSRRAFLGLARAGVDYDFAAEQVRGRDFEAMARAVAPVEAVLDELAGGDVLGCR